MKNIFLFSNFYFLLVKCLENFSHGRRMRNGKRTPSQIGFTLIELLVVIMILASLLVISLTFIDPLKQLNKFNDSKRKEDILQIKTALDTYYNDHNCYPTSLPFGSSWTENGVTYMKKVPEDPDCKNDPTRCYIYQYSGTCPQWAVVFSKLSKQPQKSACILSSLSHCVPANYDSTWACVVAGNADCSYLSTIDLTSGSATSASTPTIPGQPTDTPTPTPTPTQNSCSPKRYACTGNPARCNVVPEGTGTHCTPNCDGAC